MSNIYLTEITYITTTSTSTVPSQSKPGEDPQTLWKIQTPIWRGHMQPAAVMKQNCTFKAASSVLHYWFSIFSCCACDAPASSKLHKSVINNSENHNCHDWRETKGTGRRDVNIWRARREHIVSALNMSFNYSSQWRGNKGESKWILIVTRWEWKLSQVTKLSRFL